MTSNAIEAVGLSKRFVVHQERRRSLKEIAARGRAPSKRHFWALKDATFAVPVGSSLGIIGHNGSGKSTALKVLTGIYRPTSGHVQVNGSVAALLEVGAGFHPELTGRENIRLNATILGFTRRQVDSMMDQIIEFADIGEHIDAPIKHYSSGMYVRLGFAVAVMVAPEILIVDEVIAVGDEEFQRKCFDHLHRLRQRGTTMVIVSHGLGQITNLCDEALWLDHGEVRQIGRSQDVVRAYIDSVNQREAERSGAHEVEAQPDESDASDGSHPARRGSGDVRITGVELLDEHHQAQGFLLSGRPGTIRLRYQAARACEVSSVELLVHDESEVLAVTIATPVGDRWELPAGAGELDFSAAPLLLAGGGYRLRLAVHVNDHLADSIDDPIPLTVRAIDESPSGVYHQPGGWQLTPAPVG